MKPTVTKPAPLQRTHPPRLLNVTFSHLTKKAVLEAVGQRIAASRYKQPLTVFTPNVEQLIQAMEEKAFLKDLAAADVRFPDSIGLVWGDWWRAAIAGTAWQIRERVAGVDVAENIFSEAVKQGWKVVIMGGTGKASERAAENLKKRFEGLCIWPVPLGAIPVRKNAVWDEKSAPVIERINQIRPDVVIVGLGAPKQERWVLQYQTQVKAQVMMVVGGAIDMWSGKVSRAPGWCQRAGMEWLYRLIREPARLQRQLRLVRFTAAVVRKVG
jgi:N-acetylglucosaminyldiphosphoundecaprenol N-acetyl-beta-D-mannosaminyltransferase